jgi:6-pyruvoyltetrahydropterin/6-carboxytetrahydropterin synthase
MYRVSVQKDFIAQHFLIGGDWGPENYLHSHHFNLELELAGTALDQHNYLVDIVDIENHLNQTIAYYRDHTLNELPEFKDTNPSLERFARLLCETLERHIQAANIKKITVRLWETPTAWAGYEVER